MYKVCTETQDVSPKRRETIFLMTVKGTSVKSKKFS